MGAPDLSSGGDEGTVYLILGASLGGSSTIDLSAADYRFVGENNGDSAGARVSGAGDVDGDGLGDILIGAYDNYDGGEHAGNAVGNCFGAVRLDRLPRRA